ncbi:MAG: YkgJ family cysteine cluster protein [Desulfobacterales bacterium]|nr:YkgJ family cysteine cluster protein [Desulfobacterales bacterium]MDJ0886492.1 YkgJ family cysteine cluster protein [Desulfobacterales bacterium]
MKAPPHPEANPETCRRCGECCRQGGPALHPVDRPLVEKGLIPAACLYTIRPGEPVHDNVAGRLAFAEADIIKIKGNAADWTCCFLTEDGRGCRIYADRPEECRRMQCWDTRAIEAFYRQERLSREDLLGGVTGLWELIAHHEERCAYHRLKALVPPLSGSSPARKKAMDAIRDMVSYDESLRALLVEQGQAEADMLDFLLGRPLTRTLSGFHIQVDRTDDAIRLTYSPIS